MLEIIGESIKSATSIKLGELFGTSIKRYKESITNMQYPNFFIYQVAPSVIKRYNNKVELNYLMNIRYRQAQDIEELTTLQQSLDDMAFKLLTNFSDIYLDKPIRVMNPRCEKADGVLQFFFNVNITLRKDKIDDELMRYLQLNEQLKEEEE